MLSDGFSRSKYVLAVRLSLKVYKLSFKINFLMEKLNGVFTCVTRLLNSIDAGLKIDAVLNDIRCDSWILCSSFVVVSQSLVSCDSNVKCMVNAWGICPGRPPSSHTSTVSGVCSRLSLMEDTVTHSALAGMRGQTNTCSGV